MVRRARLQEVPAIPATLDLLRTRMPPARCAAHLFWIPSLTANPEERYEAIRRLLADWLTTLRNIRESNRRLSFDIWVGQHSIRGQNLPFMKVITPCSRGRLSSEDFALLRRRASASFFVDSPVAEGIFPELHVERGRLKHQWELNTRFLGDCSSRFRRAFQLVRDARDPYAQLLGGADMPSDFPWTTRRRPSKRR